MKCPDHNHELTRVSTTGGDTLAWQCPFTLGVYARCQGPDCRNVTRDRFCGDGCKRAARKAKKANEKAAKKATAKNG